ncbi:MAG: tRNA (N6-isopentenyl adenosine(37)-C2)-methylthiotransferase MiaB [Phycisphaerae bacterium]
MNIYLETLGCQMNRLDSELIVGSLQSAGHDMVSDPRDADVVLYNTCSVREHAEQKVLSRLGIDARRKRARVHRPLIVGVLGCMAQRYGRKLARQYKVVDIVCGPGQIAALPQMIAEAAAKNAPVVAVDPARSQPRDRDAEKAIDALDLFRSPMADSPGNAQAFVRVARGCDHFCSYCIVPYVRGPERSRRPDHVVEEVRRLVDAGRSEVTLLGQTVNRYRWQNGETTVHFSDLLQRVSDTPGLRRLRFVTSYPLDFGDDILHAMAELPNVCEYIHMPAQSGSDAVLARMNRKYSRAQYDDLVDRARDIVPGVALAGDFIVGFPGETEDDHQASADLIRRSGYKNCFVFKYSPRPGTHAARRYPDDVPEDVKKRRNNELLAAQNEAGLAHHRRFVGQRVEVLVEGPSAMAAKNAPAVAGEVQLSGRTRGDHIVVFDGPETLAGRYVQVRVTDATNITLLGERCRQA